MEEIFLLVKNNILNEVPKIVKNEFFSERYFLSEQLTADILFGGINDIPEELYSICACLA